MEVVGLVASISTLIRVTAATVSSLTKLWRLRGTPLYVITALNEVNDFKATLVLVHTALNRSEISEEVCAELERLLRRAHEELYGFERYVKEKILKEGERSDENDRPKLRPRAHLREFLGEAQQQINGLQQGLLSIKVNLTLVLGVAQLCAVRRLFTSIQQVSIVNYGQAPSPSIDTTQDFTVATRVERSATLCSIETENEDCDQIFADKNLYDESYIEFETKPLSRACGPRCSCQCHIPFQTTTPRWLRGLIGVAFVNSVGTPLLNYRSCNLKGCHEDESGTIHFSYLFPCWFLKYGIKLATSWNHVSGLGGTWSLRIPRIIHSGDIRGGTVSNMRSKGVCDFRKWMAKHRIRPFDSFSWGSQSLVDLAITENREDICVMLINDGADVNHPEASGITSAQRIWLHHLVSNALKSLTSRPEMEDAYLTLSLTCVHEYIIRDEVELLARQVKLDPRYSTSIRDVWGATPLHWAAVLGNIEAILLLLDSGAKIDAVCKQDKTVLHWAVRSKSAVCCQALVDAGANVNIMDGDGMTPLMVLLRHAPDREDIMDILLQAGVNVNMQGQSGMTALMTVAQHSTARSCAKILAYGADIELRDHGGCTAMVHAVYYRNEAAVACLIDKGSSLTKLDNQGRSIVHIAAARANVKVMKMLEAAHIEGIPKDAATIENWWDWFNDRDTWYQGIRAALAEEFSAFQALVASVRPYQTPSSGPDSSFSVPGAYP